MHDLTGNPVKPLVFRYSMLLLLTKIITISTFVTSSCSERQYWANIISSLSSSIPTPPPQQQPSLPSQSPPSLHPHDEVLWALFVHDVHMSCLSPVTRRLIEDFSSDIPTQARFMAHMAANAAFVHASMHHYMHPQETHSADRKTHVFNYSDGGEECFDADVVRLVDHILNDRSESIGQHALGWELILAQLQQCHVTLSGTFFTGVSIASAAQSTSLLCK